MDVNIYFKQGGCYIESLMGFAINIVDNNLIDYSEACNYYNISKEIFLLYKILWYGDICTQFNNFDYDKTINDINLKYYLR
jgi:hypothetical protein